MKILVGLKRKRLPIKKELNIGSQKKRRDYDATGLKKFRINPPAIFLRNLSVKMRLVVIVYRTQCLLNEKSYVTTNPKRENYTYKCVEFIIFRLET